MPDKSESEPSVEFLLEPLGIRNPAGVLSRVALVRAGAVPRCEPVTGGGYRARPREARTTGYYGYMSPDVVRADQAMVSGCVGWTG